MGKSALPPVFCTPVAHRIDRLSASGNRAYIDKSLVPAEVVAVRTLSIVMVALVLGGCGDSALESAHKAVAYQLMDPDSARFRNDRELADGSICGQVNGKNLYGAYSGFNHYAARKTDHGFDVLIDTQSNNPAAAQLCCYPLAAADNRTT